MCQCSESKRLERIWGAAGVPPQRSHCTLDGFDSFPEEKQIGKEEARWFAGQMANGNRLIREGVEKLSLCLSGLPGLGKSGLAAAIAIEAIRRGVPTLWLDHGEFIEAIHSSYEDDSELQTSAVMQSAQRIELLILDDLGDMNRAQPVTDHTRDKTYSLIRYRYEQMLPTIYTTNLNVMRMSQQFGPRVAERVAESAHWVDMSGQSLRFG